MVKLKYIVADHYGYMYKVVFTTRNKTKAVSFANWYFDNYPECMLTLCLMSDKEIVKKFNPYTGREIK